MQDLSLMDVKPVSHTQSVSESLPTGEMGLFDGHIPVHSKMPPWALYLPAGQRRQGPPLGPKEPAPQIVEHAATSTLPGGEVSPSVGHF